jgi:hypothetical protein
MAAQPQRKGSDVKNVARTYTVELVRLVTGQYAGTVRCNDKL